ncbi:hypothetical protein GOP47_0027035 [Adiantum capillus-veneris]|nr:hypothetical protein GOP47_0027035 [Adiantum capillus-veneris]
MLIRMNDRMGKLRLQDLKDLDMHYWGFHSLKQEMEVLENVVLDAETEMFLFIGTLPGLLGVEAACMEFSYLKSMLAFLMQERKMSDAKQSNVHVRDAHDRSTLGELDCCMDDEVPSSLNKDTGPISDDEADNNQPMYSVFNEDISSENALAVGCEIECCTKFSVEKLSKNLMQNERYVDDDDNPEWGFLDAEADIDNDMHVCVDEGMMHLDSGMRTKADSFTRPADFVDEEMTIGVLAALEDQDDGLEGACVQSEALQVPNASIVSVYTELKEANSNACKQFCFGVDGRDSSFHTEWDFDEPTIEMDACMTLKVQRAEARIEFLKLQQRYSNELYETLQTCALLMFSYILSSVLVMSAWLKIRNECFCKLQGVKRASSAQNGQYECMETFHAEAVSSYKFWELDMRRLFYCGLWRDEYLEQPALAMATQYGMQLLQLLFICERRTDGGKRGRCLCQRKMATGLECSGSSCDKHTK